MVPILLEHFSKMAKKLTSWVIACYNCFAKLQVCCFYNLIPINEEFHKEIRWHLLIVLRQCASCMLKKIPLNSLSLWILFNNERQIKQIIFFQVFYLITSFPCLEAGNFYSCERLKKFYENSDNE